ncbi:MAG: urease accessory protein UreE [Thermoleophilia bacterium]|nr:urease accessory protein UreE [Thermoleophilia bacterium]
MGALVVESVLGRLPDLEQMVGEIDPLELTADQRERAHLRAQTKGGRVLVISLPHGVELSDGDVVLVEDGVAVVIQAAAEDVLEVRPVGPLAWGVAAYQLGNLHRSVRFLEDSLLTPYDPATEEVLRRIGVPYRRTERGFVGERYSVAGSHHHG